MVRQAVCPFVLDGELSALVMLRPDRATATHDVCGKSFIAAGCACSFEKHERCASASRRRLKSELN